MNRVNSCQCNHKIKNAVVIGGGAIGLEMATAFIKRGLKVALIERSEHVLARSLDPDFSTMIEDKLREGGVEFITNNCVQEIQGEGHVERVRLNDRETPADIVLLGVGLRPNTELAVKAGIETVNGGIKTDGLLQTNINDVYAAGDCVDFRYRQASVAAGMGVMAALDAERWLEKK